MLKLLAPSLLAGLVAAVVLSIVQSIWVSPLILQAEVYEQQVADQAEVQAEPIHNHQHHHDHSHNEVIKQDSIPNEMTAVDPLMQHPEWAPEDGWQRYASTAAANLVMAIGFASLLTGLFWLRQPARMLVGLGWGVAGYLVFFAMPSLGLPPELPGTASAALSSRQLWWFATALVTALSLAGAAFAPHKLIKVLALSLIVIPHWVGAPEPEQYSALAPAALISKFQWAAAISNALFWVTLGLASVYFYRRINPSQSNRGIA